MDQGLSRRVSVVFFAALGIYLGCLYSQISGGGFLAWDDRQHLSENPWLTQGQWWAFWARSYYGFYIPATYSLWTALYAWFPTPDAFHALNLALHFLNAVLTYNVCLILFPQAALVATAVFALHPLQAEPVLWISGARDLLATTFALSSILVLNRARTSASSFAAFSLFLLSLLSKPGLLIVPIALAWLMPRKRRALWTWVALSALFAGATMWLQQDFSRLEPVAWRWRPLIALDALGFYVTKLVVPFPLSADYGRAPVVTLSQNLWYYGVAAAATAAAAIYLTRRHADGLVLSLAALLPVLGFVPFAAQAQSTVFDRYMYFAMIGVGLWAGTLARGRIGLIVIAALSLVWAALTWQRAPVWRDDRALAEDMISRNPASYDGLNNLATTEIAAKRIDTAIELLERAIKLKPRVSIAWANLAHAYWLKSDPLAIQRVIEPRLADTAFTSSNDPAGLALMWRMVARAKIALGDSEAATAPYCRAIELNAADADLNAEARMHLDAHKMKCPTNVGDEAPE